MLINAIDSQWVWQYVLYAGEKWHWVIIDLSFSSCNWDQFKPWIREVLVYDIPFPPLFRTKPSEFKYLLEFFSADSHMLVHNYILQACKWLSLCFSVRRIAACQW